MRNKRKSGSILRFSKEKRQALTWNFWDEANTSGDTSQTNATRTDSSSSSAICHTVCKCRGDEKACPPFYVPTSVYSTLHVECDYGIGVFCKGYSSERHDMVGTLCQIKLFLSASNFSSNPVLKSLPGTLPKESATLMIFSDGSPSQLVFDDENASLSSTTLCIHSKRYYLCFEASIKDQSIPLESLEYLCRGNKSCKVRLEVEQYCPEESTLSIRVCLLQRIVSGLGLLSQVPTSSVRAIEDRKHKQQLLAYSHGFPGPAAPYHKKLKRVNFADMFQHIHEAHQREAKEEQDIHVQHEKLIPLLRPYQVRAVRWMMKKEVVGQDDQEKQLHELWKTFTTVEGKTLYYNPFSAQISEDFYQKLTPSSGGILADEMGLGKTVEVLACILNHPRPLIQMATDRSDNALAALPEHLDGSGYSDATEVKMPEVPGHERLSPSESLTPLSNQVEKGGANSEDDIGSEQEVCQSQSLDEVHIGTDVKDDAVMENSLKNSDSLDRIILEGKEAGFGSSPSERLQDEGNSNHPPMGMQHMETNSQVSFIITSLVEEMCDQVVRIHAAGVGLQEGEILEKETDRLSGGILERAPVKTDASKNDCQILGSKEMQDSPPNGEVRELFQLPSNINDTASCKMEMETEVTSSSNSLPGANEDSGFVEETEDECSNFKVNSPFETKMKGNDEIRNPDTAVVGLQSNHEVDKMEGCETLNGAETEIEVVDLNQLLGLEGTTNFASSDEMQNVKTNSQGCDFKMEGHMNILKNGDDVKGKENDCISGAGRFEMEGMSNGHAAEFGDREHSGTLDDEKEFDEEVALQPNSIISTISGESGNNGDVQQDFMMDTEETEQDDQLPLIAKFACLCGKLEDEVKEGDTIQCDECSSWQHAKCVNWKIQDSVISSFSARYLCPHCQLRQPPTKSSATLIVSPSSICQQWVDEINRHIHSCSLKILVYQGVKKHRFLQPSFLAKHDIVITTYDILKQELNYVDLPHCNSDKERKLRHAKRYMAVPSPLPAVEWWRVCLDEAQMVECHTAKAAGMALHLSTVNRWCVTGTPVQRGLNDLYGLFLFLNEDPYRTKFWWEHALCAPYANGDQEPMLKFLTKKLWRTAKKDVLDQINIPSQTEEAHWLKFSPVEAHFYKRKHEGCAIEFTRALDRTRADPSMKLSDLDRETLHKLVHPLLSLRQACCHPQAVRGEFIRFNQSTMCMEDLLQSLISKARLECEEAQRQMVCAINGQAAMHMMEGEIVQAVEKYREVLRTADEQKGKLKVDSLQLYHTIHNLKEILGEKHEGFAPTTRDSQLGEQMKELEEKYMSKALNNLTACGQALFPISEKISSLESKVSKGPGWWLDAVQCLMLQGLEEELIMKIREDVMSGKSGMNQLVNRFEDYRGLQYVLQEEIDTLLKCFKEAKAGVKTLSKPVTPQLVAATVDCHLRPFKGRAKNDCPFCKVEGALQEYEMRLFAFEQKDYVDALTADVPSTSDADENDIGNYTIRPRGTWAMSELQKILRSLLAFLKQNYGDPCTIQEGTEHLELIEQMKKEFKPLRAYWGALLERVAAVDELDMAKMRLRAKLPDEPYDPVSQPYIIIPAEIPNQKMKLLNDRFVASSELRKKMGQLVYLENLEKAQYTLEGSNPDPCPICTRPLGVQWAVLHCGHCFCCECMSVLQTRCPAPSMKCPVCRQKISRGDISFVSTESKDEETSQTAIKVKGGYSTKVEAVVKALIQIRRNDPAAKSLVFSAWQEVLTIISRALTDNNVTHRQISQVGQKHFQSKLLDFKLDEDISTLLLPLNVACNGLNIIEATHVLLVEPILNPATELQAVGRVHRIGQTRPTIIHRFLVKQTIEEELHKYLLSNPISNNIGSEVSETGELTVAELRGMLSFMPHNLTDSGEDRQT